MAVERKIGRVHQAILRLRRQKRLHQRIQLAVAHRLEQHPRVVADTQLVPELALPGGLIARERAGGQVAFLHGVQNGARRELAGRHRVVDAAAGGRLDESGGVSERERAVGVGFADGLYGYRPAPDAAETMRRASRFGKLARQPLQPAQSAAPRHHAEQRRRRRYGREPSERGGREAARAHEHLRMARTLRLDFHLAAHQSLRDAGGFDARHFRQRVAKPAGDEQDAPFDAFALAGGVPRERGDRALGLLYAHYSAPDTQSRARVRRAPGDVGDVGDAVDNERLRGRPADGVLRAAGRVQDGGFRPVANHLRGNGKALGALRADYPGAELVAYAPAVVDQRHARAGLRQLQRGDAPGGTGADYYGIVHSAAIVLANGRLWLVARRHSRESERKI